MTSRHELWAVCDTIDCGHTQILKKNHDATKAVDPQYRRRLRCAKCGSADVRTLVQVGEAHGHVKAYSYPFLG